MDCMLRFCFVILAAFPQVLYLILKSRWICRHSSKYTEKQRYTFARWAIDVMKSRSFIETEIYGTENLPSADEGYIMYSNHQGKYDALGIMYAHDAPCSVVMDSIRSKLPIANEFVALVDGKRLDRNNMRSQLATMNMITEEVCSGRKYIIFPEGGYTDNHNTVTEFKPGAFRCAMKSKKPVVPVAIIDSYKPYEINSLRKVTTKVVFLPPVCYDGYKDMTSAELAAVVQKKIEAAVSEYVKESAV